jgi:hypothetical protein
VTAKEKKKVVDAAVREAKAVHFFAVSDAAVRSAVINIVKAAGLVDEFNEAWAARGR